MPSSFATRVFDGLASLRLAVVVMVTLGSTCAYATFYEMNHGTPAGRSVSSHSRNCQVERQSSSLYWRVDSSDAESRLSRQRS